MPLYAMRGAGLAFLSLLMAGVSLIPQSEKRSLEDFYWATSGGAWFGKWDLNTDPCSPNWFGITCGSNGADSFIQEIKLPTNNLQGTLTDLNLPNLTTL